MNHDIVINILQKYTSAGSLDVRQAHQIAIEAMKKEIPTEPTNIEILEEMDLQTGICPRCNGEPRRMGAQQRLMQGCKYCKNCGQRILWRTPDGKS